MKWLKKENSEDVQETIAESQPEQEQNSAAFADTYSKPETLEQPEEPKTTQEMTETVEVSNTEVAEMPVTFLEEPVEAYPPQTRRRGSRRETRQVEGEEPSKTGYNPLTSFMRTWIGQHWKTMAILFFIFCLALFVRSYYGVVPATENGFILSGGSDSYYHNYVIDIATNTGEHHFWDNMLNYPVGTRNPRPPLYDWSVALGGIAASPFLGGLEDSTYYVFLFSTAFWGALTIFPTYFLAREAFGRKTGLLAAFLLAVMPGHITRSVLTNADHDAMALFFIVSSFFFFLKALKLMKQKEWVSTWRKPEAIKDGVIELLNVNRVSLLYAVMAGLSLAGVSLIWKGYAYAIVIMSAYFFIQLLLNKFRNVDSLGVLAIYFVTVSVALIVAFPYYYQSIQIASWFDTPTYMLLGATAFALVLIVTRRYPWVLVFSSMIGLGLLGILVLAVVAPSLLDSLFGAVASGAGYFIQNKQYQTIAEAQAPPFSNLAMSFGIITFWLSFVGVAWAAIQLPKSWKSDFTFIFLWTATSIYMAVTAARFMFNAGPAFAITSGWVLALIISKIDVKKFTENMRRSAKPYMSKQFKMGLLVSFAMLAILSLVLFTISNAAFPVFIIGFTALIGLYMLNLVSETNPSKLMNLLVVLVPGIGALFYIMAEFYTDWEFSSATHGFILFVLLLSYAILYLAIRKTSFTFTAGIVFLAFFIIMPNVWGGLDAGIPYEVKNDYDLEIYESAPLFMQPSSYDSVNGSTWFLGGFGYSLPLNSRYWPAAYDWLATQDEDVYPEWERPAFLSWWDYGFEVVNEGKHPTVADNFLGGHELAGNFIMSQSEEDAIALLTARIIEGDWRGDIGQSDDGLSQGAIDLISSYGININQLNNYLNNPGDYTDMILSHPEKYGPRDDVIQEKNARYILIRVLITDNLDLNEIVDLYHDLCDYTGDSIRYFGIDSRLFPFSADNTGIFYAPAKLSDHRIDEVGNQPYDFWEIKAVGEYGGEYDLDDIPQDISLDPDNPYKIVYKDMFYNSMLYKCFVGYSGKDVNRGDDAGIPGLSGDMAQDQIMPGWNMTHFKLEHRTAYWNPYGADEIQNHTDAWQAMNYWDAYEKQQNGEGISDLSDRSSMYQGVMMLKYYDGAIISGKVTLEDGTPVSGAKITVQDDFGIPHDVVTASDDGSYALTVPYGDITVKTSIGTLDPLTLVGQELDSYEMHIEDYQAMRLDEDRDNDGTPDYLISHDVQISSGSLSGAAFIDVNGDGAISETDSIISNVDIVLTGNMLTSDILLTTNESGFYSVDVLPPGNFNLTAKFGDITLTSMDVTITSGSPLNQNIVVKPSVLSGTVTYEDGTPMGYVDISVFNTENSAFFNAQADENGNYSLENMMPGIFYIQAAGNGYASNLQRISVESDSNNTQDMTVYPSSKFEGQLMLPDGTPVEYGTIRFTGFTDFILMTDENGEFSTYLENDVYNLYSQYTDSSGTYAMLEQIYIEEDSKVDIYMGRGSIVQAQLTVQGGTPGNIPVSFENQDSRNTYTAFSNSNGKFTAVLPQGLYLIQVSSNDLVYYNYMDISETTTNLELDVVQGVEVFGKVVWNDDGLDYANVYFEDPSGNYVKAVTKNNGTFVASLIQGKQYKVTVAKTGFETVNLGTKSAEVLADGIYVFMTAYDLPVTGTIYLDDTPLKDQNIILDFVSQSTNETINMQVGRDGNYSGELPPDDYLVTFEQNVMANNDSLVYQIDKEFVLSSGLYDGRTLRLDLDAKLRQKFDLSVNGPFPMDSNVTFKNGPEQRSFDVPNDGGTYYIMPGNYVLEAYYASNETILVGMEDVIVSENSTELSISIAPAKELSGTLTYDSQGISQRYLEFKDLTNNGTIYVQTDESGNFDAILEMDTEYEMNVDFVEYDENYDAYHYFITKHVDTQLVNSPYAVQLNREDYYRNVTGELSNKAAGVEIQFNDLDDSYTTITDSDGMYEISLKPGVYTVYINDPFSNMVFLDVVVVDVDDEPLDFQLKDGHKVFGTAYYGLNEKTETRLAIQSNISYLNIETDNNGFYEIWLPSGDYSISGVVQENNEYAISVTYNVNKTFEVKDVDKQINLQLEMQEERGVSIKFDENQLTETPSNRTVSYVFVVENKGNIVDTYELAASGGNPDWIFDLSKDELLIEPGIMGFAKVKVTVTIPEDAKLNQNNINLQATSKNDPTVTDSTVMNVNIKQEHGIEITPVSTSPTFINDQISSEFTVKNPGNGDDLYTLYIGNLGDLEDYGWTAELGGVENAELMEGNLRIINVSVASGGELNIPLTVNPIDGVPSRQASVLITGYSQNDGTAIDTQYIVLRYPELQVYSGNVSAIGEDISTVTQGDEITNAGVMVVSVGVALAMFYYARKKRWIK